MPKSTIIFALLCVTLAAACGLVVWWLLTGEEPHTPAVAGGLSIGLPSADRSSPSQVVRSPSALLWDTEAHVIRFEKNGFEPRPIASLTKLMTAMVALNYGFDWDQPVEILPTEYVIGGQLLLTPGERATMRDLFHASLLGSANNATLALVRQLPVDETEFVRAMNRKAIALGLEQTEFVDVTGLDPDNVSTAYEIARLTEAALRDFPAIAQATSLPEYRLVASGSGREHVIKNTNKLITERGMTVGGGKTGYLTEAGFCLVTQGAGAHRHHMAVVLGSPSEWDSVQDTQTLLQLDYAQ